MAAFPKSDRIAIIGGSLGGLFAATMLLRRGFDVHVYERNASALSGRGAGIVTHDQLHAALREAGVQGSEQQGIRIPGRRTYDREGKLIAELAFPQVNTSWDVIFQMLRVRVPNDRYHLGKALMRVEQGRDEVAAYFEDGTSIAADLLIGADGIRSSVRAQLLPTAVPAYAGYVAWRGLIDEANFSAKSHAALMDYFTFYLPPGEQILGYPVAGTGLELEAGQRRCNIVWYRPAEVLHALPRMLTDNAGRLHEWGIAPTLIAREVVAEMRSDAERLLPPAFSEAMRLSTLPLLQPIYDLTASRMVFDRVVLIGDAAFVARPHVGAGVTKAALDGIALADALCEVTDLHSALARFATARLAFGQDMVTRSRDLGACLLPDQGSTEERRRIAHYRSPEVLMRDSGSLAFL
ncbi:MAG: FAD binding domain-containing protein [Hyphomicrobiaceae bacterium]|nr:NAD(P)-binding protein [Hyphomicrobiaceae bacterium]